MRCRQKRILCEQLIAAGSEWNNKNPNLTNNLTYDERGRDMLMSIITLSVLNSGMAAPEVEAVSYDGRKITLVTLRQQGPVMLVFLRGFG
jgi:hypothetical protein